MASEVSTHPELTERGVPRPHYLLPDTVELEDRVLTGQVHFPGSDVTLADRGDHVNTTHFQHAVWNAAHLLREHHGIGQPLVRAYSGEARRMTPLDQTLRMRVEVRVLSEVQERVEGEISAVFLELERDRVVQTVHAVFSAKRV